MINEEGRKDLLFVLRQNAFGKSGQNFNEKKKVLEQFTFCFYLGTLLGQFPFYFYLGTFLPLAFCVP